MISTDEEKVLCSFQWMDLPPSSGAVTVVVMSLTTRTLHVDISTLAIGSVLTPPHVCLPIPIMSKLLPPFILIVMLMHFTA